MSAEPAEAVFDPRRPFLTAAALAAGLTPKKLRGPRFRTLLRGVHIAADVEPDPTHRVLAALMVHPARARAFASHASAARVYDVPLPPGLADEHVSVVDRADRRPRSGVRTHVARPDASIVRLRGLPVSAPEQMFVDLATMLTLVDLVVVGDYLVRHGWVTPKELTTFANRRSRSAAGAARYVRRDVDSPMESRLRLLIVLAGLPEPQVNVKVLKPDGRLRYRFDLSYPDLKVVVEYDGRQHRADLDQWDHDVDRAEWLDDEGWLHVPVFSRGIYRRPDLTLERVAKALTRRGCRNVPRPLDEAWRSHFPVRA